MSGEDWGGGRAFFGGEATSGPLEFPESSEGWSKTFTADAPGEQTARSPAPRHSRFTEHRMFLGYRAITGFRYR